MTPEQIQAEEKYFETLRDLFSSEGWEIFTAELQGSLDLLDSVEGCKTVEDLYYRKGQMATCANILNMRDMIERAEEDFLDTLKEEPLDQGVFH